MVGLGKFTEAVGIDFIWTGRSEEEEGWGVKTNTTTIRLLIILVGWKEDAYIEKLP